MQISGIGRVIFWSGGSLWIGQSLAPSVLHAHHAIQLAIGLSGPVQFRPDDVSAWNSHSAAIIAPDLPHTYQANGCMVAHLFCEPESVLGRSLLARFGRKRIAGVPAAEIDPYADALRIAFNDGVPDEDLEDAALDVLHALAGYVATSAVDDRITRAAAFIHEHLADPLTLEAVAQHVGLSPGRFRHLFVAETGISFRGYLLWTRLKRALELGFGGTSWTDAAHATNFADSAHLSRTTRRMYGLAPSSIRQDVPPASRLMTA